MPTPEPEATRLIRLGFEQLVANRIEIRIDERNVRSAAVVAERLGFRLDGTLRCDARGAARELRDTRTYSTIRADLDEKAG